jgi:hypothetical protein
MELTGLQWRKSSYSGPTGGNCVEVAVVWRKSSRSEPNGGQCVEVAVLWRKSSRSEPNGGNCVEVAGLTGRVAVRDSKNPDGPKLVVSTGGWRALTRAIKSGRYDSLR